MILFIYGSLMTNGKYSKLFPFKNREKAYIKNAKLYIRKDRFPIPTILSTTDKKDIVVGEVVRVNNYIGWLVLLLLDLFEFKYTRLRTTIWDYYGEKITAGWVYVLKKTYIKDNLFPARFSSYNTYLTYLK